MQNGSFPSDALRECLNSQYYAQVFVLDSSYRDGIPFGLSAKMIPHFHPKLLLRPFSQMWSAEYTEIKFYK